MIILGGPDLISWASSKRGLRPSLSQRPFPDDLEEASHHVFCSFKEKNSAPKPLELGRGHELPDETTAPADTLIAPL